ncbi:MAG: hypothetical protein IJM59_08735 [Proteobacteria bacterium]|nr:hypothetical protein [Pseudomonadota bacterium]
MRNRLITTITILGALTFSGSVFAESNDSGLLAYGNSQSNNADDDIFAAMQALDEVGALLDAPAAKPAADSNTGVDVESLLAAANSPEPSEPADSGVLLAAADKPASKNVTQPKSFKVPDDDPVKPEPVVQTAPAKEAAPVAAAEPEAAPEAVPVAAAKAEPKHDVQTAPVKEAAPVAAVEPEPAPEPAPVAAAKAEPKHDVQTASVKGAAAAESEAAPKPAPVVAAKAEPKHNVQTAPVKGAAAAAPEAAPKTDPVVAAKTEPKHDVQTAPVKNTTIAAKTVAPDGSHMTQTAQAGKETPKVDPGNAPHSLPMAYVMAIYQINGVDLSKVRKPMPSIAELYQHAFSQKLVYQSTKPAIGDLVFFHNTFDRNRDGRWNDWHSLVGIVESIDQDETISILVYQKDKIERIYMNLKYPELQRGKKGQVFNSQLRANEGAQNGISSKLFAGFANLLGDVTSVTVIDNWTPGMNVKK